MYESVCAFVDADWNSPFCPSYKDQLGSFVEAYNEQSKLRQEAEAKLDRVIFNRMEEQVCYLLFSLLYSYFSVYMNDMLHIYIILIF